MAALRRLILRDFVIVDQLDVELADGFTALTGETGAGKSILIDALQLALGNRADAGVVREGCTRADITAEFEVPMAMHPEITAWLIDAGLEPDEETDALMLRRVVDASGKSRAWINGRPATVSQLRALADGLVDIHGQHAWQSLNRPDAVRALLDEQAGVDTNALAEAWARRRAAQQALTEARERQASLDQERDRLQWQVAELGKLAPGADEWASLNEEHSRLSHGQAILDAAQTALALVSESEDSTLSTITQAMHALQEVAHLVPALADAVTALSDAQTQAQEAVRSLNGVLNHTDLDPQRLAELDARLSAWMAQARRHRRQPADLHDLLAGWQQELSALEAAMDLDALERQAAQAHAAWHAVAQEVSAQRQQAAPQLAAAVTETMQGLGMAGGAFAVALLPQDEPQAWGLEAVELRVAGHAGSTPRALAKVASGGELSRLALAIAVSTSQGGAQPGRDRITLIFDEIDAGVGGEVAGTVGRLMQQLGQRQQVMAVTHLAQVAACAHGHLVVSKSMRDGQTLSDIRPVTAQERENEIARMLGGASSDTSLAHARAMLDSAKGGLSLVPAEANTTARGAQRTRSGRTTGQGKELA
jgi:DNA repair protein RecN (Recombination protein N)